MCLGSALMHLLATCLVCNCDITARLAQSGNVWEMATLLVKNKVHPQPLYRN